jgi:hypothetical protein
VADCLLPASMHATLRLKLLVKLTQKQRRMPRWTKACTRSVTFFTCFLATKPTLLAVISCCGVWGAYVALRGEMCWNS